MTGELHDALTEAKAEREAIQSEADEPAAIQSEPRPPDAARYVRDPSPVKAPPPPDLGADRIVIGGAFELAAAMPAIEYVISPVFARKQMVAVTGRPGEGKSTTCASMLFHFGLGRQFGPLTPESDGLAYYVTVEDMQGFGLRLLAEAAVHHAIAQSEHSWHISGRTADPGGARGQCGSGRVRAHSGLRERRRAVGRPAGGQYYSRRHKR